MALSKVLIIKHGSLGDIFMALDSITSIHTHFGNNIFFLTTSSGKKVLEDLDFKFNFIIDSRSKNPVLYFKNIKKLISENFDYIIDIQNSKRTCSYIAILKLFRKLTISSTCLFATHRYVAPPHGTHHVSQGLSEQLRILNIKTTKYKPKIKKSIKQKSSVLIVPGSSLSGKHKRWSYKHFNELIEYFLDINFDCFVIGGDDDLDLKNKMKKHPNVFNLIGLSPWRKVIELSLNANLAISNDTSNMHLISGLGCPTVAIMNEGPLNVSNSPNNEFSLCIKNADINQIKPNEVFKRAKKIAR